MYGTVARIRPKPGHIDQLIQMSEEWKQETSPQLKGFVGEYVYQLDDSPEEYLMVVIFSDRQKYFENAESPEQNEWFLRMREHLEADPVWQDGEIIYSSMETQV